MRADVWWQELHDTGYWLQFPQQSAEIMQGLTTGIAVDFTGDRVKARLSPNLPVSATDADKITAGIAADVAGGKKAGPFDRMPFSNFVCSPIGCVPKKNSHKIRIIHHLSWPRHGSSASVNQMTRDEYCRLGSFDDAANAVRRIGRYCYLIKLDVEAAYKQVPVRPEDWHLLGFVWQRKFYYERTLPFGLKSSCRKWELYASALHFFFHARFGIDAVIHYIDDFLFVVESESDAHRVLADALALCARLGVPMSVDKTEGPCQSLTFLGIQLDTVNMRASVPADKMERIQQLLATWAGKTTATISELQSLTGVLNDACQVVRPGRTFLRRIIDFIKEAQATSASRTHAINRSVRADVDWWRQFVASWNGTSLLYQLEWTHHELLEIYSDACQTGFGAKFGS